jgi:hypothetical protein
MTGSDYGAFYAKAGRIVGCVMVLLVAAILAIGFMLGRWT